MADRTLSGIAGLSLGLLAGIPLINSLTGVGSVAYLLPLAGFVLAIILGGATRRRISAAPEVAVYGGAVVLLVAWLAASALWAIPELSALDDLFLLAALLAFVVAAAFAFDTDAAEPGIYAMLAAALLAALYVFGSYVAAGTLRGYGALQGAYLLVAQLIGLGTVLAVLRALTAEGRLRWIYGVLALVLLGGLGLSLARGALLSAVVISVLGGLYATWLHGGDRHSFQAWLRDSAARLGVGLAVLVAIGVAVGSALQVERTRLRLIRLFVGGELSEGGRAEMWRVAWENIAAAPVFGHGLGSSGVMSGRTPDLYPHNWALQVWLDGGLVGLVLCVVMLALPLLSVVPRIREGASSTVSRWLPLVGGYMFLLLEYSKSSDFYTARLLLVVGVVLVYVGRLPRTVS